MLNFGNKEFRNLQEQVLKNMRDIQDIEQGATVLADFGIKIVGQVETAAELPNPATYEGEYGDGYVVGESEPYNYYIFTRAFEGQDEPSWFDLGQFPVPGPTGPQGPQGETGATPVIIMQAPQVSTLNPGQPATASVNVGGTTASPSYQFNFGIPQGAQGVQGPAGAQGPQGPQGPKGDKGDKGEQGGLIEIVGIVATANDLPSPASLQKLDAAYLVGASPDYELYVQVGTTPSTALWTNLGKINEGTVVTVNGVPQTVWEAEGQFVPIAEGLLVDTVYGQKAGTGQGQTHVPYGTAASGNALVQRDASGQVIVPATPSSSVMAASKGYVDSAVSSALPTEQAGDLIVGTSTAHQAGRLAIGSSGQVLKVNSNGDGLEYGNIEALPAIQSGDAGKVLTVSANESGAEWATASSGGGGSFQVLGNATRSNIYGASQDLLTGSNLPTIGSGLVIDGYDWGNYGKRSSSTTYTTTGSLSNSILIGSIRYGKIPDMTHTLILGDTGSSIDSGYPNSYSLAALQGDSWAKNNSFTNSLVLGQIPVSSYYGISYIQSIITNATNSLGSVPPNAYTVENSIIMGTSVTGKGIGTGGVVSSLLLGDYFNPSYKNTIKITTNKWGIKGVTVLGIGNSVDNYYGDAAYGHTVVGKYANSTDPTHDRFVVGDGTDTSARHNCFTTGNDGTADYIKIGSTKLTETQLQALLATL